MTDEIKIKKGLPLFIKFLGGTIVLVALSSGITTLAIRQNPQMIGLTKGAVQQQAEVDALIAEVGKLIDLPKDEKPTVATVSDSDKLKDQQFFKNAKTGDKVLIYTSTKRAILYRPSEHRIIDVGAVNIRQQDETPTPTPSEKPTKAPTKE